MKTAPDKPFQKSVQFEKKYRVLCAEDAEELEDTLNEHLREPGWHINKVLYDEFWFVVASTLVEVEG